MSKGNGAKRQQTGIRKRHTRKCRISERRTSARETGTGVCGASSGEDCACACACQPAWEAFVYSRREHKKVRKTFPTQAAAKSWHHDTSTQAEQGTLQSPLRLTLDQAAEAWTAGAKDGSIRNRSRRVYKPSTVRGYEQALALYVLADLGGHQLADIGRRDVKALAGRLQARGLDPSTIRNAIAPLRAIYRHHDDDLPVNPTVGVPLPAVEGRRDRIADPSEAQALLDALAPATGPCTRPRRTPGCGSASCARCAGRTSTSRRA